MGSVSINPAVRPTAVNNTQVAAVPPQEVVPAGDVATPEALQAEEQAPAAAPAPKQGRGLFGHFADVFIGGGQAIWDMASGIGTLITHPIQTIKGLGYAITHPAELVKAFVDPYAQAIAQGRPGLALGRGIVEIGSFFITGGGGGAAKGGATAASTGAKAAGAASKAGKAAAGASKAAKAAGTAAKVAGRAGKVPVMTKAAAAATKAAGVSTKTANAALKAAQIAYWEARSAGKAATVAKAAAAAKAAKIMGLTKSATAVQKITNAARLAGAAADTAKWFTRTNYVTRPLVQGAKIIGRPVDAAIVAGTKISTILPGKIGSAVSKLGSLTLKQIALAPITVPMAAIKGVGNILSNGLRLGNLAAAPGKVIGGAAAAAGKLGSMSIGQIIGGAFRLPGTIARAALANPASLIKPAAIAGMANRVGQGALARVAGPQGNPAADLTDEQAAALAEQYGLEPTKENVAAFIAEVQSYAGNTIGPDTGEPDQVKQLQTVLRAYGYDVDPTGTFDDKTATAVIDFKTKKGITQSYKLADGTPAVNEYVDEATAAALVAALKAGEKAGDAPKPAETEKPAEGETAETEKPAEGETPAETEKPAEPVAELPAEQATYTVTAADRAAGLSGIARRYLGDSRRWKEIYDLNKDVIGNNPNLILPGQKLKLPAGAKGVPGAEPKAEPKVEPKAEPKAEPKVEPKVEPKAEEISNGISDAQIAQLAKDYGLKATRENVEAFSEEVNSYRENAVGPDVGDEATIRNLQAILVKLGFKVAQSGTFDEATTQAVIDFKLKNGLHQRYKLANGDWAINEYVDEDTAQALATALSGK